LPGISPEEANRLPLRDENGLYVMAEKKKFLLRIDSNLYAALEKWAADELRSINAQIEFLLANAIKISGRQRQSKQENEEENNPQNLN